MWGVSAGRAGWRRQGRPVPLGTSLQRAAIFSIAHGLTKPECHKALRARRRLGIQGVIFTGVAHSAAGSHLAKVVVSTSAGIVFRRDVDADVLRRIADDPEGILSPLDLLDVLKQQ